MLGIRAEGTAGMSFDRCMADAVALANTLSCRIDITVNDVEVCVYPKDDPRQLARAVQNVQHLGGGSVLGGSRPPTSITRKGYVPHPPAAPKDAVSCAS